jgi:hypothetical protein
MKQKQNHEWMLKGIQALKEKKLKEELKEAIQQSKEGKTKHIDVSRFAATASFEHRGGGSFLI